MNFNKKTRFISEMVHFTVMTFENFVVKKPSKNLPSFNMIT